MGLFIINVSIRGGGERGVKQMLTVANIEMLTNSNGRTGKTEAKARDMLKIKLIGS